MESHQCRCKKLSGQFHAFLAYFAEDWLPFPLDWKVNVSDRISENLLIPINVLLVLLECQVQVDQVDRIKKVYRKIPKVCPRPCK